MRNSFDLTAGAARISREPRSLVARREVDEPIGDLC